MLDRSRRGSISLGDAIIAVQTLSPLSAQELALVLRALGRTAALAAASPATPAISRDPAALAERDAVAGERPPSSPSPAERAAQDVILSLIEELRADSGEAPAGQDTAQDAAHDVAQGAAHDGGVTALAMLPDGGRVLSGSLDCTLRLWDLATGAELRRFEGHSDAVTDVMVLADGRRALSRSRDRTLRLWDVETGVELRRFVAPEDAAANLSQLVIPEPRGQPAWGLGAPETTTLPPAQLPARIGQARLLLADFVVRDPAPRPLVPGLQQRGIVNEIVGLSAPDGPIDMVKLVRLSADLKPLEQLPRSPRRALRGVVTVIADLGPDMVPYRADVLAAIGLVRRVAGRERVRVRRVLDGPPALERLHTRIPDSMMLVVSNCGLGPGPDAAERVPVGEWLAFAEQVRREGCAMRTITMVPPGEWPDRLRKLANPLLWDQRLSARSIRRALGR